MYVFCRLPTIKVQPLCAGYAKAGRSRGQHQLGSATHDKENVCVAFGNNFVTSSVRPVVSSVASNNNNNNQCGIRRSTPSIFGSVALLAETACPAPVTTNHLAHQQLLSPYHFKPIVTAPTVMSSFPWVDDVSIGMTSSSLQSSTAYSPRSTFRQSTRLGMGSTALMTSSAAALSPSGKMTSFLQSPNPRPALNVKVCVTCGCCIHHMPSIQCSYGSVD